MDLKKFTRGAIIGLLTDPQILYDTIATVIQATLEMVPMDLLLQHLDNNTPPEEIFRMIPVEYTRRIVSALGDVDEETIVKIRALAVRYINLKNVLYFLRKNNVELYTVFINHPNGKAFLNNFITYVLQNLDSILRAKYENRK